jgi:hypothetical protein
MEDSEQDVESTVKVKNLHVWGDYLRIHKVQRTAPPFKKMASNSLTIYECTIIHRL